MTLAMNDDNLTWEQAQLSAPCCLKMIGRGKCTTAASSASSADMSTIKVKVTVIYRHTTTQMTKIATFDSPFIEQNPFFFTNWIFLHDYPSVS